MKAIYKAGQSTHNRDSRRRRKKRGELQIYFKNYGWKVYKSKGNWYTDMGSTEGPKETYTKTYYNKMTKVKDKERILKAASGKQRVNYKGTSIRLSGVFSTECYRPEESGKIYSNF